MRHNLYLDKRYKSKSGEHPLMVTLSWQGRQLFVHTGVKLATSQWDTRAGKAVHHPLEHQINIRLSRIRLDVEEELLAIPHSLPHGEVRRRLSCVIHGEDPDRRPDVPGFAECLRRFADSHDHERTMASFYNTLRRMEAYCDVGALSLEDITAEWLMGFEEFMALTAKSANSRSVHLRNIRSVMNNAITLGLTDNYPFRRFKIRSQPTRHRALTVDEVRELLTMEVQPYERQWRDMWLLMFLLCGISPGDLVRLREVRHGRVSFSRSKTGEPVDIKVEPEAEVIISWYRGRGQLLDILDRYEDYTDWLHRMNNNLKTLGGVRTERRMTRDGKTREVTVKEKRWPELSAYWARHTWASIAYSLGVSIDVIGQALGHSQRRVTEIYIAKDRSRVDEANRKVIDWVLYGKK